MRAVVAEAGLRVLEFIPEGSLGCPFQDLWVIEKLA
jgi:hypothetical protein